VSDVPAAAAGVFTRNRFPGAPVVLSRARLRKGRAQAVVINSGISNVAMGERGRRDAQRMTEVAARALGLRPADVLVSSTGVIGQPLPMRAIEPGIRDAAAKLGATGWSKAARAILTTDTRPKLSHQPGRGFALLGIAKGSGMVMPDLATMLCYLVTDLAVDPRFLREALVEAVEPSFNRLTIDGETSTSDTVTILANGLAGNRPLGPRSANARDFRRRLGAICEELTEKLAADAEGMTRLGEIVVTGARSDAHAVKLARRVANSVLVKTALFGADPNFGRIVQAAGAAGVPFRIDDFGLRIGGIEVMRDGAPRGGAATQRRAERAARKKRVRIEISLGRGPGSGRILTTDLGYGYVRINAEYTT
jgi:glutamate N-acetyltransferase/amino-acid N-acetyltransferase